jgi:hypothetical protein
MVKKEGKEKEEGKRKKGREARPVSAPSETIAG